VAIAEAGGRRRSFSAPEGGTATGLILVNDLD
jgi:hypothetical protein